MKKKDIIKYRKTLRQFERELFFQNYSMCCNGLSMSQCHAMLEIEEKPGLSLKELAEKLSLEKSTVSRSIDQLTKNGFIDRVIPPDNRRSIKLELTEKGIKACKDIHWNSDNYIELAFKNMPPTDQDEFLRLFRTLTGTMLEIRQQNLVSCKSD